MDGTKNINHEKILAIVGGGKMDDKIALLGELSKKVDGIYVSGGNINSIIYLTNLYDHLDIIDKDDEISLGIVYAEFGNNKHDRICKGFNAKKQNAKKLTKKTSSTKRFDNSITILLRVSNNNAINVKLFKNGKIQIRSFSV